MLRRNSKRYFCGVLITERQITVLEQVITGKSNIEIAKETEICLSTVKWHLEELYKIYKVKSRYEMMSLVFKYEAIHGK